MTPAPMKRIGAQQLAALAEQLDAIDRHLLELIDIHRYATTRQLAQLVSLSHAYASARSALRQTTRRCDGTAAWDWSTTWSDASAVCKPAPPASSGT